MADQVHGSHIAGKCFAQTRWVEKSWSDMREYGCEMRPHGGKEYRRACRSKGRRKEWRVRSIPAAFSGSLQRWLSHWRYAPKRRRGASLSGQPMRLAATTRWPWQSRMRPSRHCSTPVTKIFNSAFVNHHVLGKILSDSLSTEDNVMPKMSDSRRKRIQAKQRKATNALQRAAKIAKRERNNAKPGAAAG